MSPPKSCAVCGDKALGYNFNAVTCESCKAFFRRNALARKPFTCPFNQNCEITVVTRRFCQKCRLKKCIDIGMKSENIMSEEDKLIKRRKIENNRAKRRLTERKSNEKDVDDDEEDVGDGEVKHESAAADSSGFDASHDSHSCGSYESSIGAGGDGGGGSSVGSSSGVAGPQATIGQPQCSSATSTTTTTVVNPELMTSEEMVEYIVADPDRASQAITNLMRTPKEAMASLEKIINSQKDALRLISHLIAFPGDALKIISKIMNSPFNALTVFTKFMSSPTDALEIISKIVSSPQDVLQFIRNLMDSPEDALDIMNKFMNSPKEALKILKNFFNGPNPAVRNEDEAMGSAATALQPDEAMDSETPPFMSPLSTPQSQMHSPESLAENTLIHSMLNSSPSGSQVMAPPGAMPVSPYAASPQAMSIASPASLAASDMQYHSPAGSMQNSVEELPSTSAGLMTSSPASNINTDAEAADFASEQFDIKTFIQNSFPDNAASGGAISDSINSLESVLTEVIRIEFQAFNNLPPEPRVKSEHQQMQLQMASTQGLGGLCNPGQQQLQQQPICAPSSVIMGRDLNDAEQMKLRELRSASEALYYPVDDDLSVLMMGDDRIKAEDTHQDPKLLQVINLTAVAIKRLIKMAKKITAFRDMCQEDQVALLKGGCTEMMIMRSVMTYDDDRNTWKIPHTKEDMSNIRAEVLKLAKGNVYEEHLKFIRTFDEKWRMDENIILIMCAIVLFTPTRPRVIHSDVIKLEQNSYYYLLRRYLESVYAGCEARSAFIKLIQKISDVERLNHVIIGVYLNVNPSQVEPLLREIFDLKNH